MRESQSAGTAPITPAADAVPGKANPRSAGTIYERLAGIHFPVVLWLISRVALLLTSKIALEIYPTLFHVGGPTYLAKYPALAGFCRWDCGWYDQLARQGYQNWIESNFWPLYPLLVRATSYVGIPIEFGLLFWSNLACLGGYILVYRVFIRVADEGAARWGLALLAAYPFSFFHAAGYGESLMIFFTAGATLCALRGRHLSAGVLLGLGTLARHISIFAGAALLAAQLRARGRRPLHFVFHRDFLGLLLPFVIAGLYPLYCYLRFGDPFSMMRAREAGWSGDAWMSVGKILSSGDHTLNTYVLFGAIPLLGTLMLLRHKEWAELAAYAVVFMAIVFSVGGLGLGRYSASCWPAFLPLGVVLAKRPNLQAPVVAAFAMLQGMFLFLWAHQHGII